MEGEAAEGSISTSPPLVLMMAWLTLNNLKKSVKGVRVVLGSPVAFADK